MWAEQQAQCSRPDGMLTQVWPDKEGAEVITSGRKWPHGIQARVTYSLVYHHLSRSMKLYPLVLAFASAGIGLSSLLFCFPTLTKIQTAGVNAIPLRVALVHSSNEIGPPGKFFDNPSAPSVRSDDGLYHIQVVPPVAARRRPCHSMSDSAVGISNRFRKLFGFDQIETHPAVEHHHHPHHAKLVPIESIATMPFPPPPTDGEMHILPFENVENTSAPPVHRHSHHHHHRLQNAPFMERLSHSLMMLGRWEGRAIAFVLGEYASG